MAEPEAEQSAQTPQQVEPEAVEPKADETDWKAESRKWESRAKENVEKARQFDALVESQKTEQQKLIERAEAAEKAAQSSQTEALRYRVATRFGISDDDAETFLTGADEASIIKQAERLAAMSQPGKPRGDVSQGPRGTQPEASDPASAFANILQTQLGQ